MKKDKLVKKFKNSWITWFLKNARLEYVQKLVAKIRNEKDAEIHKSERTGMMLDGLGRTGGQLDATSRKQQQHHTSLENEVNVDAMLGDETNQITSSAALAGLPAQKNIACRRTE